MTRHFCLLHLLTTHHTLLLTPHPPHHTPHPPPHTTPSSSHHTPSSSYHTLLLTPHPPHTTTVPDSLPLFKEDSEVAKLTDDKLSLDPPADELEASEDISSSNQYLTLLPPSSVSSIIPPRSNTGGHTEAPPMPLPRRRLVHRSFGRLLDICTLGAIVTPSHLSLSLPLLSFPSHPTPPSHPHS